MMDVARNPRGTRYQVMSGTEPIRSCQTAMRWSKALAGTPLGCFSERCCQTREMWAFRTPRD